MVGAANAETKMHSLPVKDLIFAHGCCRNQVTIGEAYHVEFTSLFISVDVNRLTILLPCIDWRRFDQLNKCIVALLEHRN